MKPHLAATTMTTTHPNQSHARAGNEVDGQVTFGKQCALRNLDLRRPHIQPLAPAGL
jgi:hypothetical protein